MLVHSGRLISLMKYHVFALCRDISSITPYAACLIPRHAPNPWSACTQVAHRWKADACPGERLRWGSELCLDRCGWGDLNPRGSFFKVPSYFFTHTSLQTHSDPLSLYWSPINQAPERKDSRSSLILLGQGGSQYQASFQSIHLVLVVLGNRRAYILVSVDLKTSGRKHVLLCLTTVWVLTDMTFKTMQIIRRIEITNSSYHDISLLYEAPNNISSTWVYMTVQLVSTVWKCCPWSQRYWQEDCFK